MPRDGAASGARAPRTSASISRRLCSHVAQSMQNPEVVGVATGPTEASAAIGGTRKTIDGQGPRPARRAPSTGALTLNSNGIILGGSDPTRTADQVRQANASKIPLVGWQAPATPDPSDRPKLFGKVITGVEDVAKISTQYLIIRAKRRGGHFTDSSIPVAEGKSQTIPPELQPCPSVEVLKYGNIPVVDGTNRMPTQTSALLSSLGGKWTCSVASNEVYSGNATAAFRQSGRTAATVPGVDRRHRAGRRRCRRWLRRRADPHP